MCRYQCVGIAHVHRHTNMSFAQHSYMCSCFIILSIAIIYEMLYAMQYGIKPFFVLISKLLQCYLISILYIPNTWLTVKIQ